MPKRSFGQKGEIMLDRISRRIVCFYEAIFAAKKGINDNGYYECCGKRCRKPLRFFISHNFNRKYVFYVKVDKLLTP